MITIRLNWHNYRYFPYERILAAQEVESLFGVKAVVDSEGIEVVVDLNHAEAVSRLTYFKSAVVGTALLVPDQAKLEASALPNGQKWIPGDFEAPSLRRQSTRYSAHGIHEYRGKFNPQLVRVIGNIIGLREASCVLDPFCGSGTSLLESAHIGWNALGFDVNPLAVMIANAKVAAFKASPDELKTQASNVLKQIASTNGSDWESILPNSAYLAQWFARPVLENLAQIVRAIDQVASAEYRPIFRVILSDICREVSYQDPGDLRIRRRKEPFPEFDTLGDFNRALVSRIDTICSAREHIQPKNTRQSALNLDCRSSNKEAMSFLSANDCQLFDAAITSPPYVTAMPYVDTQRLSLCLLGLIDATEIRATERSLIGNREITDAERLVLENNLRANSMCLPPHVLDFCMMLLAAADHSDHGFRRRNVPGLAYKYFGQMAEMFDSVSKLLRQGGKYALVVGGNMTRLQGEEIQIDTPDLLKEIAESRGWGAHDMIRLETYHRYDVHQKNSIRNESLVILSNDSAH